MIKPLRGPELDSLQYFYAALSEAMTASETLKERLESVGMYDKFVSLKDEFRGVLVGIMSTIPEEKRKVIKKNMENQGLKIVTGRNATESKDFTYVPTDALYDMCRFAAEWNCKVCDGEKADKQNCKYRKALMQVLMVDVKKRDGCEYKYLMWEE